MRRTLAAMLGFVAVIAVALAIVVVRPGSSADLPNLAAVTPTTAAVPSTDTLATTTTGAGAPTTTPSWDVPVSPSAAIASVQSMVDSSTAESAKLMTYGDWQSAGQPGARTPATPASLQVWAVEVVGKVTPDFAPLPSYPWGIWLVDAHTGDVIASAAGLGASPQYWDSLPDHAAS